MKRYNVTVPKLNEKTGKTYWNPVGSLVQFPATEDKEEGFILELNMFPNTSFKVFPQEDRKKPEAIDPESQEVRNSLDDVAIEPHHPLDDIPF